MNLFSDIENLSFILYSAFFALPFIIWFFVNMSRDSKLKPIYDYIDNASYKKALTEIDKLLKKTKDVQYVKSLRALCLVRLERGAEGQVVLDELRQLVITDDATLQAMTMAFLDLEQFENISQIYDTALKNEPGNEKLSTHLFMSYVRVRDFPKQKQTALNLFKAVPKNPYYFWAVMSIYMQALEMEDQNMANKIILPLAEKMCKKFQDEKRFEAEAEVELYLMILEKQSKFEEMIRLIDSEIGKSKLKDYLGFVSYRKVDLLKKVERYEEAFELLLKLVEANIDQFNYYIEAFELIHHFQHDKSKSLELLERLWNVVIQNCSPPEIDAASENYFRGRKSRGPFIVQIVLAIKLLQAPEKFTTFLEQHKQIQEKNYVRDLLLEFFNNFGHKTVCFKDMYFVFQKLGSDREVIQELLLQIQASVLKLEQNNLDDIQRYICYLYLKFYVSEVDENRKFLENNKKQLFDKHIKVYEILKQNKLEKDVKNGGEVVPLEKVELDKKEQCPFDSIIHLIMLYFSNGVDLYQSKNSEDFALDLLSFLEMALKKNDMDFYSKLFLVRLYASLGAGDICFDLFQALEVKHVLLDSLGFQFMQPILTSGCFGRARKLISQMSHLYKTDQNEQSEYVVTCYRYGSFGKIAELKAFFDKLQNSIQHHLFFAERFSIFLMTDCKDNQHFHNLMTEALKIRSKSKWDWTLESTTDNRDMSIYTTSLALENYVDEMKKQSKAAEFHHCQYHIEFLQSVLSSYYLFNSFSADNKLLEKEHLESFVRYSDIDMESLQESIGNIEQKLFAAKEFCKNETMKYYFQGPPPSRLFAYISSCHHDLLLPMLNYMNDILKYFYGQSQQVDHKIDTAKLLKTFQTELDQFKPEQSFHSLRKFLEYSSLSLETINFLLLMVEIVSSTLNVLKPGKKLKKVVSIGGSASGEKLSNYEQQVSNITQNTRSIADFVGELFTVLRQSFKILDENFFSWIQNKELTVFADFEEIKKSSEDVKTKLLECYKQSLNDQILILEFKHKYLKQLSIYKN